jgi:hypothetical protein
MQEIYAGAERVLIWLGPASGDSDSAIAYMKRICKTIGPYGIRSGEGVDISQYERKDFESALYLFTYPADHNKWTAVIRLLSRTWWDRAWVVQEVASAQNALCYCGKPSIPWHQVALIIRAIGMSDFGEFDIEIKRFVDNGGIDKAWNLVETRIRFSD